MIAVLKVFCKTSKFFILKCNPTINKLNLNSVIEKKSKKKLKNSNNIQVYKPIILEMLGDIPKYNILPSEKVIFICKLNPLTDEADLLKIFRKYGCTNNIKIVRDYLNKRSLNYGFIEFYSKKLCENAILKNNNLIIDDSLVKLDFCQSIYK